MNPEQNLSSNQVNEQPPIAPVAPVAPVTSITPKPFPLAKLLLIIFGPGAALVFTMILQIFVRFLGASGVLAMIINIVTLVVGAVSVISIILMPVFIIVLIVRYNKQTAR